jgi:hypothetical protein
MKALPPESQMPDRIKSWWIGVGLLAAALATAGCTSTGHLNIFGYTTEPNYDSSIHTIYVPIAQNITMRRGLEFQLTQAVLREIAVRTPFRIVSCAEGADTQLDLKVITWRKNLIITTPTNQNRQAEIGLGVEVVWKDLRPERIGEVLSNPRSTLPKEPPLPGQINPPPGRAIPVLLLPVASFEPELGGSNATAEKQAIDRVAIQIVSMMEKSW